MAVETQRCGQVPGASTDLVLLSLARGEGLVYAGRTEEGYQGGAELLPEEGREVRVGVDLLRQGRYEGVQALEQEDHGVAVSAVAGSNEHSL